MRTKYALTRIIMRFIGAVVMIFGFGILIGCGEDDKKPTSSSPTLPTGTVTGRITLPSPAPGKQMYVLIDKDCDGEEYTGIAGCTCGSGTIYEYTFENYPIGIYFVYAIVYTDEIHEGGPDPGDYFGYYSTGLNPPDFPNVVNQDGQTKTCDFSLYVVPSK